MKNTLPKTDLTEDELSVFRQFLKFELEPRVKEYDEKGEFPEGFFRKMHDLGYLQAFLPSESGGTNLSTLSLAKMMRAMAFHSAGISTSFAGNLLAWVSILQAQETEDLQRVITEYSGTFFLSSFCFTEPEHGSDVFRISTTFEEVGGEFILNGKKCFVTNGNFAKQFVVVARRKSQSEIEKNPEFQLFLVPRESDGVSFGKPYEKMGHRESNTTDLYLSRVRVPRERQLRVPSGMRSGLDLAFQSIQRSRILLAAAACGVADRALDLARTYLKDRVLYGKSLLTQPQIRGTLVQSHAECEAVWQMCRYAGEAWDSGARDFTPSSMAKLLSGQMVTRATQSAVELFGGWGCVKEFGIEKLYRDAKFYEILEGPTFVQQAIIAKELLSK
jgi:alkylation response protein AidB-like acyl-CoA dehydrogenase